MTFAVVGTLAFQAAFESAKTLTQGMSKLRQPSMTEKQYYET
jgi:hypothetical protein